MSTLLKSIIVASRFTPAYRHYVRNQGPDTFIFCYKVRTIFILFLNLFPFVNLGIILIFLSPILKLDSELEGLYVNLDCYPEKYRSR